MSLMSSLLVCKKDFNDLGVAEAVAKRKPREMSVVFIEVMCLLIFNLYHIDKRITFISFYLRCNFKYNKMWYINSNI